MSQGTALITGASSGIGAVYADRLARRGYDLILVARDIARMNALADRLRREANVRVDILSADLSDLAQMQSVEHRIATDDTLTLLVNNAGISLAGTLIDTPRDSLTQLIAVNVTAPTLLAAAAVRAFASRGKGAIINLSSVLALAPEMFDGTYSGTKAFILSLTQGLAKEVVDKGIHVQAVLPGATRTEIWGRAGIDPESLPAEAIMGVDAMVDAALAGLDQGEAVTIPSLPDAADWQRFEAARLALGPNLSRNAPAARYLG